MVLALKIKDTRADVLEATMMPIRFLKALVCNSDAPTIPQSSSLCKSIKHLVTTPVLFDTELSTGSKVNAAPAGMGVLPLFNDFNASNLQQLQTKHTVPQLINTIPSSTQRCVNSSVLMHQYLKLIGYGLCLWSIV